MSLWYGIWYGYASQNVCAEDVEIFHSLERAKEALHDRYYIGATIMQSIDYVNKPPEHALTPGVLEDSEILLFPTPDVTEYPARRVFFGPHGGVRTEYL